MLETIAAWSMIAGLWALFGVAILNVMKENEPVFTD